MSVLLPPLKTMVRVGGVKVKLSGAKRILGPVVGR